MGNTMGKKRKMSTASSAKWVAPEVHSKKDGLSPLGRSYSMPVHHAKPKADKFHVVALTSSTYGILKVDLPKGADESRTSMSQNRTIGDAVVDNRNIFQEKLMKFDVPEIMVPKPWSGVEQILSKLKPVSLEGGKKVQEPEVLKGLKAVKEEPETINMWELMEGLDEDARSPSPLYTTAAASRLNLKPASKKVRNLESSLSFSAIHTITEVDVGFLEGAVKSELKSAVESGTLVNGKCYTRSPSTPSSGKNPGLSLTPSSANAAAAAGSLTPSSGHGSGKEDASSSPAAVFRGAAVSTLNPVKLNSSANVLQSGSGDPKGNSSKANGGFLSKSPNKVVGTPVKAVNELPVLSGPSDSVSNHNSRLASSSWKSITSTSSSPQPLFQNATSPSRPAGYPTSSSSDDFSEEHNIPPESPLFDPELLASFEKAIEDVSEDEWYRVRRSDAGVASTSGSSSDGDSPLRTGSADAISSIPAVLESSPLTRSQSQKPESDLNPRRIAFSKVAPVDFRDVVLQKVVKVDPFEKFDKICPPGGEERVVIYVTSLRGIRKTFEDCSHMKLVILGYRVAVDERDVSMHADFRQELKNLLGKPMPVPRLFIRGCYIGGAEEVSLLHEDGTLAKLLETMPTQTSWEQCDGCGDHRFVPCPKCSGSCKVITEDDQVARCTECNENGLVRCPMCF